MKFIVFMAVIVSAFVPYHGTYQSKPGECERFTYEFLAGNIQQQALDQLLIFSRRTRFAQPKVVRFHLYTRHNPHERQLLYTDDESALQRSHFNKSLPMRFVLHGWSGHTTLCSNAAIKDAYIAKGEYNVILVDWSDYSLNVNYIRVIDEMYEVAGQLNAFTAFLQRQTGVPFAHMYLIGHSLSCHIAGVAGKLLRPHRYGVIYGLDPAGPGRRLRSKKWRLTADDAIYVEQIHTDITLFGIRAAERDADAHFYPNWGLGQPQCPNGTGHEEAVACDHFTAVYYFVESLQNGRAFGALRCDSWRSAQEQRCGCGRGRRHCPPAVYMGGDPAVPKRGVYYLSTRASPPYGYGAVCTVKRPLEPTISNYNAP